MIHRDNVSFVESETDSEDEIDHLHRKAKEALDKAKAKPYPLFAIRSNIAFNAEMLASEDVPLPGQMVTFGVRDYLHVKARFSQDWWIARLVRIGSVSGFIPSPAKIDSIRMSIWNASSASNPTNVTANNMTGTAEAVNGNNIENVQPQINTSFDENIENTMNNLGERPMVFNHARSNSNPNSGPIQNLAASRRLVPEIDEDGMEFGGDIGTNGNDGSNNNNQNNSTNPKSINQKSATLPLTKKKQVNKKNQFVQSYELVPIMRPVVFLGPALKGFEVTDMMQKAIFDFLRKHFEGRIIITRISSDLTQMKRITSGSNEKKIAAAMATHTQDNSGGNSSALPSANLTGNNINNPNNNFNNLSTPNYNNNNNNSYNNNQTSNGLIMGGGGNMNNQDVLSGGGILKNNLFTSASANEHQTKVLRNIQEDIERIYELSSHMQLVVLDADTINHPGQLNKTCLAPLLVYIKIVSMKVLSKLIKNRGKSQKNNASFQLSAAEKLQQCPDESFDLILDQNNLAGASECLRHFLETYWIATHPSHAQTKAERILQSRGEPPLHSLRKMSKSDPEFGGANVILQAGLEAGFTVKEMNSLIGTSMWWATLGTNNSQNTTFTGGSPPSLNDPFVWGGDPEEYRSDREMRVDQRDRGSSDSQNGDKSGLLGNNQDTVTPLLKPVSPDIFMSKLSLKSQLLTHTATSNHMAPMNNHDTEPTKIYLSRSILHQQQRLAELEEKKRNEKDLARQRRKLVRMNNEALQATQNQTSASITDTQQSASGKALKAFTAFAKSGAGLF